MFSLKLPLVATLAASAIALAGATPSRAANDADFILRNLTGYQIDEVYVSPAGNKSWGPDIMGTGALAVDTQVKIVFPHGNGACMFDLKVKYHDDGSSAEWGNVDLCKYEIISLYWDAKNQVSRATGE